MSRGPGAGLPPSARVRPRRGTSRRCANMNAVSGDRVANWLDDQIEGTSMSEIEIVESYLKTIERHPEIVQETRRSTLSRMVWIAGITGFVLLNAQSLWEALIERSLSGQEAFWLSLPWVATAMLAVLTHILIDEVKVRDDEAFEEKMVAVELWLIDAKERGPNDLEMIAILNDSTPEIKKASEKLAPWVSWASRLERLTFVALLISFLWALVGPFALDAL